MTPTRFILLTLALLAFVSLASAAYRPTPPACSESCDNECLQTCCKTAVGYYQSLIAKSSGCDGNLISVIIKALADLLETLLGLTCGNLSGNALKNLIAVINVVLSSLGEIVFSVLDLLAGKLTEKECRVICQAIANKCIADCEKLPGSGGILSQIVAALQNLLQDIIDSGVNLPGNGSGTGTGSVPTWIVALESGVLPKIFNGATKVLTGALGAF